MTDERMNKFIRILSLACQKRGTILVFLFFFSLITGSLFLLLLRNIGPEEHSIPGTDYLTVYKHNTEYFLQEGRLEIGKTDQLFLQDILFCLFLLF